MKDVLEEFLANDQLRVYFTKKDKSERAMVCTLDERRIPPQKRAKSRSAREDIVTVFDVEKGDWRTITVDAITGVERV